MGDIRVDCKIEMEGYGIKDKYESYLTWRPGHGIHQAILDWIEGTFHLMESAFDEDVSRAEVAERKAREERIEKCELERLKEKYENNPQPQTGEE